MFPIEKNSLAKERSAYAQRPTTPVKLVCGVTSGQFVIPKNDESLYSTDFIEVKK